MLTALFDRVARRRGPCREGHVWTDMAAPPACRFCGRSQPADVRHLR